MGCILEVPTIVVSAVNSVSFQTEHIGFDLNRNGTPLPKISKNISGSSDYFGQNARNTTIPVEIECVCLVIRFFFC